MKLNDYYFSSDPSMDHGVPSHMVYQKRCYLPYRLVIHHSAGNLFKDASPEDVSGAFGREGRKLFRRNGEEFESFLIDPFSEEKTWTNAQYALHPVGSGYELVPLVKYPLSDLCWHANNWPVNMVSLGVEICGNYMKEHVPEQALITLAAIFRPYASVLRSETGKVLQITGHKDHSPTECPGKIYEQLGELTKLIHGE